MCRVSISASISASRRTAVGIVVVNGRSFTVRSEAEVPFYTLAVAPVAYNTAPLPGVALAEYRALLEDTERKRRDKFRVTAAMLESAAASVPADGDVVIVEGFAEPPKVVGRAGDFHVERNGDAAT